MKKLRFISNRVLLYAAVMEGMLFLSFLISGYYTFCEVLSPWISIVFLLLFLISGLSLFLGIIRPYLKSEKMTKRFLEGYFIDEKENDRNAVLTPYTQAEIQRIGKLLHSTQLFDLNKRQAQYLALQNQINPHFLYNTLESIRSEALISGLDGVADMTEALAKFFRYTITKVENLVTVEEELQNCETYFRIQQYRFGDRLMLHIDCAEEDREEIMHCRIPKLTLQPILENSIIHGTELKIGKGNLHIRFERTEKRLIIIISDDGVGMDEKILYSLNEKLGRDGLAQTYSEESDKGGIALVNVNNRIRLIFGEEYGMHVYSIRQKGTDVEISIPAITRDMDIPNKKLL